MHGREQRRRRKEEPIGLRETMEFLTGWVLLHFRMHFRNLLNKYQKLPKRDFDIMFGARKSMERCCWPRQGRSALLNLAVDILKERAMRRKSTAWSKVCTGLDNSKIMRTDNVPSMFAGLDIVPK